ncbi:MAG: PaaX family transcriptional regulator [Actinobacteria bacterium]|nr:PaaX family transcriptional regulator [Actinomycetota bacterium]
MVVATATRRRADGGPSARSLLISVLGQWVGPNDTPVWTATLVGALEALGIEARAARQAVNRTAADGWLEGESVGRYTRWRLTSSGRRMIGSAVPRVQRSIVSDRTWDGTFLLLTLTGIALDREERERLAVGLDFEGFGTLGPGTWVAVGEGSREGADSVLSACGLQDRALLFSAQTVDGAETPAEVVALAWDLDTAAAAHEAFLEEFEKVVPEDECEAFALRTRLAHEWRHLLSVDPSLPPQLLPADWVGTRARKVFQLRFSEWAEAASSYYIRLCEEPVVS